MTDRRLGTEVVATWLGTLVLIRLIVVFFSGVLWDLPLALVPILFMWAPVWVLQWRGEDPDQYPLLIPGFSGQDAKQWRDGLRAAALAVLVITVPYVLGYHIWQTVLFPDVLGLGCDMGVKAACAEARRAATFSPEWRFPDQIWKLIAYHLLFVAIPEELFYRGYVQSRLDDLWPTRWRLFGAEVGPGWLWTCAIFAFGHSIVMFQWWHFAIFFPSLVFGWLRARTGGVLAGAFFHAWCNVLVEVLDVMWGVALPRQL